MITNDSTLNNTSLDNALAMNTLDVIPSPSNNAKEITGLVKESGKITGYQLSDGQIVSKADGVQLAKEGQIVGVGVAHRNSTEYLKSLPDGAEANNLSHLPTVN